MTSSKTSSKLSSKSSSNVIRNVIQMSSKTSSVILESFHLFIGPPFMEGSYELCHVHLSIGESPSSPFLVQMVPKWTETGFSTLAKNWLRHDPVFCMEVDPNEGFKLTHIPFCGKICFFTFLGPNCPKIDKN